MDIVFALLPIAVLLACLGAAGFIWAVKKGQYEDLETPAMRILFDDEPQEQPAKETDTGKS